MTQSKSNQNDEGLRKFLSGSSESVVKSRLSPEVLRALALLKPQPEPAPVRRSNFLVFLGAGASKPLGIPTMVDLVNEFRDHVEKSRSNDGEKRILGTIIDVCQEVGQLDIEAILKALNDLTISASNLTNRIIAKYCNSDWPPPGYDEKISKKADNLFKELKNFLKFRCSSLNRPKVTEIYDGLFNLLFGFDNLIDVFTTNYDMAIETYARQRRIIDVEDGFQTTRYKDTSWYPARLDVAPGSAQKIIRLHKLHGSISWYMDEAGKIHWSDAVGANELLTWGKVENLLIYPLDEKSVLREPFFELFLRLRNALRESPWVRIIVIGYSFRDEHIRYLIKDALTRRAALLVIIDPNADKLADNYFWDHPANLLVYKITGSIEDEMAMKELGAIVKGSA